MSQPSEENSLNKCHAPTPAEAQSERPKDPAKAVKPIPGLSDTLPRNHPTRRYKKGTYEMVILKEMLREQLCCLGRVFAKYNTADNIIWEIAKGFDLILQSVLHRIDASIQGNKSDLMFHKKYPHPGLLYLLDKINKV